VEEIISQIALIVPNRDSLTLDLVLMHKGSSTITTSMSHQLRKRILPLGMRHNTPNLGEDPNSKLSARMMDKTIIPNQTEQTLFQRGRMMAMITMMRMRMASAFLPCEFE
jgi:hypothetical protein